MSRTCCDQAAHGTIADAERSKERWATLRPAQPTHFAGAACRTSIHAVLRWVQGEASGRDAFPDLARGTDATFGDDRSILEIMKIATGKVVGGKVEVEGASFEEGTSVTVLARDEEGGVALTPEEEAELLLAIAEADRGELVSAEEVLAELARRHG